MAVAFRTLDPATYGRAAAIPDPEDPEQPYRGSVNVEETASGWAVILILPIPSKDAAEVAAADYEAHRNSTP